MKKFLLFLLVLIIALVVASQFLLPSFIGSRIESQLNETLKPTAQTVNVEAQPAFKILYGEVDRVYGTLENIKLGKLNFASFQYDAKQILVNPISLLASQQIDIVSVGTASIDGTINKADLATFLSNEAGSDIQDVQVDISKDNISLTGKMNVGMVFKGDVKLDGNLELKGNTLLFSPKKFTINGATIPGMTSNVLESTQIYDFNNFPIPVKAESLTVDNGEILIKVKPVLN